MADLIKGPLTDTDEQDLEQDELSILQKANILLSSRQAFGKRKSNILFFADSAEEGTYLAFFVFIQSLIWFALDIAAQFAEGSRLRHSVANDSSSAASGTSRLDLGWKSDELKRNHRKPSRVRQRQTDTPQEVINNDDLGVDDDTELANDKDKAPVSTKRRLLKELSARLRRDTQLRYAQRELEMQRLLMGKGAKQRLPGWKRRTESPNPRRTKMRLTHRKGGGVIWSRK